jgi:hypothetical protein
MSSLHSRLTQLEKRISDNGRGCECKYVPLGDPESNVGYWRETITGELFWELPEGAEGQRPVYIIGRIPLVSGSGYIGNNVGRYVPYVPPQEEFDACLTAAPAELGPFPEVWKLGRFRAELHRSLHLDIYRPANFQFEIPVEGSYFDSMMYYFSLAKEQAFSTEELEDFAAVKGLALKKVCAGGITTKSKGE